MFITQLLKLDNKQNFLHLIAEQLFFTMDEFELLSLREIYLYIPKALNKMPNVYCKRRRSMLYSPAWASRAFIQVQKFAIGF